MELKCQSSQLLRKTIQLIAGHEFRTPMNGIYGFAQILKSETKTNSISEKLDNKNLYLDYIFESAVRLKNLSERIEIWYGLYEKNFLSLESFIFSGGYLEDLIKGEANKFCEIGDCFMLSSLREEQSIFGTAELYTLVLKEILNNAFKFGKTGSIVKIHVGIITDYLIISIENISEVTSLLELKTYEVFMQFNRDKYEQQGLGLGIDIAELAIGRCGGFLEITGTDTDGESLIKFDLYFKLNGLSL